MLVIILLAVLLTAVAYYLFFFPYKYWEKLGVPSPPVSRFFGNIGQSLFMKRSLGQIYADLYNNYPTLRYVGFYKVRQPGILLRDPEIIKEVVSVQFNNFHDNDFPVNEDIDPLITRHPFLATGEKWKFTRNRLTPCFTSKQLKSMVPLMDAASKKLIGHLEDIKPICIDAKELSSKYTADVVASCGFGLEVNSFENPNSDFRKMTELVTGTTVIGAIKFLIQIIAPSLGKILKVKFIPDEAANYYRCIISETLKYRKDNKVVRGDFLDMMLDFRKQLGEDTFTDDDITGYAIAFLADGIDSSALGLSYALFDLATSPEIQDKLRKEVDAMLTKCNGILDWESIHEMTYMDKFFAESMRMHPIGMFLPKLCTQSCTLPSPHNNGPPVTIEPNTTVSVPVYALHYDPQYFPDPERFDPERFSEENKDRIVKYTYLPFGEGPRACLGQRFAALQIKIAVVKLISKFDIRINNKTRIPFEIDPSHVLLVPKGGIWLDFYERK